MLLPKTKQNKTSYEMYGQCTKPGVFDPLMPVDFQVVNYSF
jgi:hypothetical protein